MFAKQRGTQIKQSLAVENTIILQQIKPWTLFYMMFHLTLNFFIHIALACVHKCFSITGHLKYAKTECLWSSIEDGCSSYLLSKKIFMVKQKSWNRHMIDFNSVWIFLNDFFMNITLETAPNEMQCDETISHMVRAGRSHFRTLVKRVDDCRQNIAWLLRNAPLTTLYVKQHYMYMVLVARDLYKMCVLYRGKYTTWCSMVRIWSEARVYHAPAVKRWQLPENMRLKC